MFRFFVFGRNLPDWTVNAYHRTLIEDHAPLVQACSGFVRHCAGYVQNHVQNLASRNCERAEYGPLAAFRNCSEFWFDTEAELHAAYANDDYMTHLRPDEMRFGNPANRAALGAASLSIQETDSIKSGQSKVLVLHEDGNLLFDGGVGIGPIVQAASRRALNQIVSTMDFSSLRFVSGTKLPFSFCSELWFDGTDEADRAVGDIVCSAGDTPMIAAHVIEHWVITPTEYLG